MAGHTRHFLDLWTEDGITVVSFVDCMLTHEETLRNVEGQLNDLVETIGADMLLNFREVRYMSSALLAILLPLHRRITRAGGELKLCHVDSSLQDLFRVTGLGRLFPVYPDEPTALETFKRHTRRA